MRGAGHLPSCVGAGAARAGARVPSGGGLLQREILALLFKVCDYGKICFILFTYIIDLYIGGKG